MFSVGDKIVYPMHGAGIIQGIEEIKILGEKKRYYIFKLPCSDVDLMVPVESDKIVGLRAVVTKEVIENVVDFLRQNSSEMDSNWSKRYRENMEKLKSGDIMNVAEVVRNLGRMEKNRNLSSGEKRMFDSSRQILISEMVLAAGLETEEAEMIIDTSM